MLARTSNGLDVFRHYLPVKWRVGRNFLNPLYADSKASCNVYYDRRSGTYRMKDFGNGDYSGDCFFLVAKLKGLDCRNAADFVEVLHTIDRELCLGLDGDSPTDGTVGTGGCRRLRLVPGARGGGAGEAGTDTEPLRFNEHTETAARDPRSLRFSGKKQDGKRFFSNKRKKSNRTSQKSPPLSQTRVVPERNIPEPPSKTFFGAKNYFLAGAFTAFR